MTTAILQTSSYIGRTSKLIPVVLVARLQCQDLPPLGLDYIKRNATFDTAAFFLLSIRTAPTNLGSARTCLFRDKFSFKWLRLARFKLSEVGPRKASQPRERCAWHHEALDCLDRGSCSLCGFIAWPVLQAAEDLLLMRSLTLCDLQASIYTSLWYRGKSQVPQRCPPVFVEKERKAGR